jgi:DNA-directed RNA polymerase subunit K/omega
MSEFPSEELEYSGLYYDSLGESTLVLFHRSNDIISEDTPRLTPYEVNAIISARAKQIQDGACITVDIGSNIIDPIEIATKELIEYRVPMVLMRRYPNGIVYKIPLFETKYILPRW